MGAAACAMHLQNFLFYHVPQILCCFNTGAIVQAHIVTVVKTQVKAFIDTKICQGEFLTWRQIKRIELMQPRDCLRGHQNVAL